MSSSLHPSGERNMFDAVRIDFEEDSADSSKGKIVITCPEIAQHDANSFQIRGRLNSLRQYLLGKVETIAIDKVEFEKNKTNILDEALAVRFGCIPLDHDCRVSKRAIESAVIEFDVRGEALPVGDCAVRFRSLLLPVGIRLRDESGRGVADTILCQMSRDGHLRGRCWVRFGTQRQHAKFQSISSVHFDVDTRSNRAAIHFCTDGTRRACFLWRKSTDAANIVKTFTELWSTEPTMKLPYTDLTARDKVENDSSAEMDTDVEFAAAASDE